MEFPAGSDSPHAEIAEPLAWKLRLQALFDSAIDASIVADGERNIRAYNKAAERMFGYGVAELHGRPLTLLMPARYQAAHSEGLSRLRSTGNSRVLGTTVELAGLRKDGREFPLELSLATWKEGADTWFSGTIRDISDRKRTEQALHDANAKYRALVDESMVGVYILQDKRYVYVNSRLAEIFGRTEAELLAIPNVVDTVSEVGPLDRRPAGARTREGRRSCASHLPHHTQERASTRARGVWHRH